MAIYILIINLNCSSDDVSSELINIHEAIHQTHTLCVLCVSVVNFRRLWAITLQIRLPRHMRNLLGPSIHKFDDELIDSGLSAARDEPLGLELGAERLGRAE